MRNNEVIGMFGRYLFLLIMGSFAFQLFYIIFSPLTVYPSFALLKLFYSDALLNNLNSIIIHNQTITLVEACIGGAAYFLLLLLNFGTPLSLETRLKSLLFLFGTFLVINIVRIVVFSALYISGFAFFDLAHIAVWYFGSTVLVILLWFLNVWYFKVQNIPFYSDIMGLMHTIPKRHKI